MSETSFAPFVPRAVRDAAARANTIVDAINKGEPLPEPFAQAPDRPSDPVPEAPAPEAPAPIAEDPPPAPAPAPTVGTPAPDSFEARYRSLQGKYNSETADMRGRIDRLETLLSSVQTPPVQAPTPPTSVQVPEQDVTEFGADLVAAARRWARAEVDNDLNLLRQRMATLEGSTQQIKALTSQDRLMASLDGDPLIGPTWRTTNQDPDFLTWLQEIDPFTGHIRKNLLTDAYNAGDAARTAAFFQRYKTEQTAISPAALLAPSTTRPDTSAEARPTLESMAAPGRGGSEVRPGAPPAAATYSRADIATFYREVSDGKWRDREDQRLRREADIIAASTQGRIRT